MNITKTRRFRALLRRLLRLLNDEEDKSGYSCGLSFTQCHTLLEIGDRKSATVAELADSLRLDKSTLSRTVESLVDTGLIQRREDPGDRRFKILRLTAKGTALRREIDARADERFGRALSAIPTRSREPVLQSLEVLVRSLSEQGSGTASGAVTP